MHKQPEKLCGGCVFDPPLSQNRLLHKGSPLERPSPMDPSWVPPGTSQINPTTHNYRDKRQAFTHNTQTQKQHDEQRAIHQSTHSSAYTQTHSDTCSHTHSLSAHARVHKHTHMCCITTTHTCTHTTHEHHRLHHTGTLALTPGLYTYTYTPAVWPYTPAVAHWYRGIYGTWCVVSW